MRKKTLKKTFALVSVIAFVLFPVSCQKKLPIADFSYSISNENTYAICSCSNYSMYADSYEWRLTGPSTNETSYSTSPSFRCYHEGYYDLTLKAYNKKGTDIATKSFYVSFSGGGGGGNPIATAYTITWLRLEKIPMLDTDNSSWDTGLLSGADPDIKFQIQNSTNSTTYYTSPVKDNVSSSDFPVTWYNVNTTLEMGKEYRVRFLDQDELDPDDIMANCVWKQSGYFSPGASTFTWYSSDHGIKFTVGLSWVYGKSSENISEGYKSTLQVEGDNHSIDSK